MKKLSIVATILAKSKDRDAVKAELLKLIEPTLKEDGCIRYELFCDNDNENLFIFLEEWQNDALLSQHLKSEHMNQYTAATKGMIEQFVIHKLSKVD